jgi:enterobactin synthetase component D
LAGDFRHPSLPVRAGEPVSSALIAFDGSKFDPRSFEREHLALPARIESAVPRRQAEFFFGRMAARAALAGLGLPPIDIPIGADREPVWPRAVVGSLSHCAGFAAAAVAHAGARQAIGIDLEVVRGKEPLEDLRRIVLDDEETRLLGETGASLSVAEQVTLAFSAKESFYKAAFPRLRRFLDFDAVRVELVQPADKRLWLRLRTDLAQALWRASLVPVEFEWLRTDVVFTYVAW